MNANQINATFRKAGLGVRIRSGGSYYYWTDAEGVLLDGAESVYVYRASSLTPSQWLDLARDVDTARKSSVT